MVQSSNEKGYSNEEPLEILTLHLDQPQLSFNSQQNYKVAKTGYAPQIVELLKELKEQNIERKEQTLADFKARVTQRNLAETDFDHQLARAVVELALEVGIRVEFDVYGIKHGQIDNNKESAVDKVLISLHLRKKEFLPQEPDFRLRIKTEPSIRSLGDMIQQGARSKFELGIHKVYLANKEPAQQVVIK